MNNNNVNKLVPVFRFPEFKDAGEWEVKKLGEVLDYERPDKYIVNSENYVDGGIPVLTANKSFILGYTNETEGVFENLPAIIFDDFTTDKKYVNFPFKVKSSAIKILRPKEKYDLKFIFDLMSLIRFEAKEHKRYYISAYQNLTVPIPELDEQQKIASCLSSIDEVITGEQQKLELLKEHKKGLLQNLFPQEGETVPKLRFKEFENSGEWEVKKLGELCVEIKEKTNGRKFKLLSISSGQGLISQIEKFGKEIAGNSYSNYTVIRKNDFAYNKSSTKSYPEGEIALMEEEEDCAVPNSIFTCFRFKQNLIIPYFAKYLFVKNHHGRYLRTLIAIGARAHGALQISTRDLFSVPIPFPSLPEQQKIASCLSSLDDLITAQTQKIEQLQRHKKGLLQGLFPNVNDGYDG